MRTRSIIKLKDLLSGKHCVNIDCESCPFVDFDPEYEIYHCNSPRGWIKQYGFEIPDRDIEVVKIKHKKVKRKRYTPEELEKAKMKLWAQLNEEANLFGVLPKRLWNND